MLKIQMLGIIDSDTIVCSYRKHSLFLVEQVYADKNCTQEKPFEFGSMGYINSWMWTGDKQELTDILTTNKE